MIYNRLTFIDPVPNNLDIVKLYVYDRNTKEWVLYLDDTISSRDYNSFITNGGRLIIFISESSVENHEYGYKSRIALVDGDAELKYVSYKFF